MWKCTGRPSELHFAHAQVDVPRGEQRHRQQPVARSRLDLGAGVVEDLEAGRTQRDVLHDTGEPLPAESDHSGEHDLGPHSELVHELDAGDGVVRRDVGAVDLPLVQAFEGPALVAVIVDDTPRARAPENRPVDTPAGHAVEPYDLGHATLQRCRCATRPEIVLFGHVGVGVDHLDLVERESHVGPFV
jgi:hypothetical protein